MVHRPCDGFEMVSIHSENNVRSQRESKVMKELQKDGGKMNKSGGVRRTGKR